MKIKNYYKIIEVVTVTLFFVNALGCIVFPKTTAVDYYNENELEMINRNDGITKEEAVVIARSYLIKNGISEKVNINNPKVADSHLNVPSWFVKFNTRLNMKIKQGLEYYEVHVDKITGEIKVIGWWPDL